VKVNTRTGLIKHPIAMIRDACILEIHPVVGMSATVAKRNTTYVNTVRCCFRCFEYVRPTILQSSNDWLELHCNPYKKCHVTVCPERRDKSIFRNVSNWAIFMKFGTWQVLA